MNSREAKRQYTRALRLCSQTKYEEAYALLNPLLQQFPDDTNVLTALAFCLAHLGRSAEAKALYQRLAHEFNDPSAHHYLQALKAQSATVVTDAPGKPQGITTQVPAPPARDRTMAVILVVALTITFLIVVIAGIVLLEAFGPAPEPAPQWAQNDVPLEAPAPITRPDTTVLGTEPLAPAPSPPAAPGLPTAATQAAQHYAAAHETYRPQRTPAPHAPPPPDQAPSGPPEPWHPPYVEGMVYVQIDDPCFHRHNCPLLIQERIPAAMAIEAAQERYVPCPCMEFDSLRDTAFWIWRGEGPLFTDPIPVAYPKWVLHWRVRQEGEIHVRIVDADTENTVGEGHAVAPGGGSCTITQAGTFRIGVNVSGPVLYFLKAEGQQ